MFRITIFILLSNFVVYPIAQIRIIVYNLNIKAQHTNKSKEIITMNAKEKRALEQKRLMDERMKKMAANNERKAKNAEKKVAPTGNNKEKKQHKSISKAAGLKSTFVIEDELLMTSFGKGNDAVSEKRISKERIVDLNTVSQFNVEHKEKNYKIKGRSAHTSEIIDPRESRLVTGVDELRCKDKLEMQYFGRTFNDNIHIQLIYNILDIEKILAIHINNIVYELNNLRRVDKYAEYDDFVGYLDSRNNYDTFCNAEEKLPFDLRDRKKAVENVNRSKWSFDRLVNGKRLLYFGEFFAPPTYKKDESDSKKEIKWLEYNKKVFALFSLLGELRQFCAHSRKGKDAWLYNLEKIDDELLALINNHYNKKIHDINKSFIEKNKTNLYIIYKMFPGCNKQKFAQHLYDFVIYKDYKYLGFSIKKLREKIMEFYDASKMKSTDYDSVRHKLNLLFDFVIYIHYITDKTGLIENNVSVLRSAVTEDEKELFYNKEAERLWSEIKGTVNGILLENINGKNLADDSKTDMSVSADSLNSLSTQCNAFSKFIYMITMFLDGKEINDLLTTLINKFENIRSFIDVLKNNGMVFEFSNDYKMFENSKQIAMDIRAINSFARMKKPGKDAKRIMYKEAAEILGVTLPDEKFDEVLTEMLRKETKEEKNSGIKIKHDFRNFIASNVIESDRFKYLIRYANPKHIREIANNENVIRFVLKGIPETQIDRYYKSCKGVDGAVLNQKIDFLTDIITGIDFMDFSDVNNNKCSSRNEKKYKEQKQAVITLYLTVMYLLTKNLVYVNSRYFLAFHCLERDTALITGKEWGQVEDYCLLTKKFISEDDPYKKTEKTYPNGEPKNKKYIKDRYCRILENNLACNDATLIRQYRNNAAHIGAVRNAHLYIKDIKKFDSYFELYHYITQRTLEAGYYSFKKFKGQQGETVPALEAKSIEYFAAVRKYDAYCKDFVKALNTPFGYKLARYKNLSINELFDKNAQTPTKETGEIKESATACE